MDEKIDMIEKTKIMVISTLKENYKKFGYLTPVLLVLIDNKLIGKMIPSSFLKNAETKEILADNIKSMCLNPLVQMIIIIIESYYTMLHGEKDRGLFELLKDGNLRVSQLPSKKDCAFVLFATPEKEDTRLYLLDPKNKTVGKNIVPENTKEVQGIFTDFFTLRNTQK